MDPLVFSALLAAAFPNIDPAVLSVGLVALLPPKIDVDVVSPLLAALLPNMEPVDVLPLVMPCGLIGVVAVAAPPNMPPPVAPNPLLALPNILPPLSEG